MDDQNSNRIDLEAVRAKLANKKGPAYWRGLEEVAETPEFKAFLDDEFPNRASLLGLDRRDFLKLMGASLALAGVSGCRYLPQEKLVPYVRQPEDVVPGKALYFASAVPFFGYGRGVLVESHMGRPTKIEGNPDHPASVGGADMYMLASVLDLYDPDRAQSVTQKGQIAVYEDFLTEFRGLLGAPSAPGASGTGATGATGAGSPASAAGTGPAGVGATGGAPSSGVAPVRILTETVTSPTLAAQLAALLAAYPNARWHTYEPAGFENTRAGARLAFGRDLDTLYHFDRAATILSLDSDFLLLMPGSPRYARDFATARRVRAHQTAPDQPAKSTMSRLYAVECVPNLTGASADNRLPLRPSDMEAFARALAQELGVAGVTGTAPTGSEAFVRAVATDLRAAGTAAVVVPGEGQPPAVHAIAHAINDHLGAIGTTVTYIAPVAVRPPQETAAGAQTGAPASGYANSLKALVADMQAHQVQALLIVGGNPAYTAPADVPFAQALGNVPTSVHLSQYDNETSALCKWLIPESHALEAWSDIRAYDATPSIIQPLIAPLYESRSVHEVIAALSGMPDTSYNLVRSYWRGRGLEAAADFDRAWEKWLNDGVVAEPPAPTVRAAVTPAGLAASAPAPSTAVEISFRLDPTVLDGRFANNAWLQEMPKPLTKLTWDNALYVSPAMAQREKWAQGSIVTVSLGGREVKAPVWIQPGQPDNTVTVSLGYGRTRSGSVGTEIGFNANALRTSDAPYTASGVTFPNTGGLYRLATPQTQSTMFDGIDNRRPVQYFSLADFAAGKIDTNKESADLEEEQDREDIFKKPEDFQDWAEPGRQLEYKWAMAIDLNVCIGCEACSMACQSENNIPPVGKEQVEAGRWMNWIRVDRYYETDAGRKITMDNPRVLFQPVPCMQCEKAPCEPVCPVGATLHSHEGLNQMVYNRCVGTRYCSNNCPYKVRRFNFYKYTAGQPANAPGWFDHPSLKLVANPEVTVRGRGVMEKCSYCVQRINRARIEAKKANNGLGREIQDGEIVTACAQACPTHAITFGSLTHRQGEVSKWKAEPHNYDLLADLNTKPRTSYLAKMTNSNDTLEPEGQA